MRIFKKNPKKQKFVSGYSSLKTTKVKLNLDMCSFEYTLNLEKNISKACRFISIWNNSDITFDFCLSLPKNIWSSQRRYKNFLS